MFIKFWRQENRNKVKGGIKANVLNALTIGLIIMNPIDKTQAGDEISVPKPGIKNRQVWITDMAYPLFLDGRAYLVDVDEGKMLGMINTGAMFQKLDLPSDYSEIYSVESYYSRGARGKRTDVVSIYDRSTLAAVDEVIIPAGRYTGLPTVGNSSVTDNNQFLAIYNMSPAQTVSIVDVKERKFIDTIDTPGCALVYPSGAKSFHMLCGNGSLLTITLDKNGKKKSAERSKVFFDPMQDPLSERAVRLDDVWLYVTWEGIVHPVDISAKAPRFLESWSLFTKDDRKLHWGSGGRQHLAVHQQSRLLFSLVHQSEKGTSWTKGMEVWAYDIDSHEVTARIKLERPVSSITLTQGDNPLLLTVNEDERWLDVYDAESGQKVRTIKDLAFTPMLLQPVLK